MRLAKVCTRRGGDWCSLTTTSEPVYSTVRLYWRAPTLCCSPSMRQHSFGGTRTAQGSLEIKTLMQGIPLSLPPPCATEPLPPAVEHPTEPPPPPPPQDPHPFPELEDTTGKAVIGRRRSVVVATPIAAPLTPSARASAASTLASTSTPGVGMSTSSTSMSPSASADLSSLGGEVMVQDEPEVSRTTKWRQLKRAGLTAPPPGRLRRAYVCKVCKRPEASEGHTRFQGHRYCPYSPGRYQRMSGWPSKEKRPRPRRHWRKAATAPEGSG